MELLERDDALETLAAARASASRGAGRVVLVAGEPGIGKSALVTRFLGDLAPAARVLLGTCDDLSVPRPLGPVHDLAGGVASPLVAALAAGEEPHAIHRLVLAELERAPRPTVLVLEDVHWADGATLDLITVLGRRIAAHPALLVLTLRRGETPPGHPLHAAIGAIPADVTDVVDLAPLSREAVVSLAGEAGGQVFAATAGNPFYVTELLASDGGGELPPTVANAVVGRVSRLEPGARALLELLSVVPNRVQASLLDAVRPGWAGAAEEAERRRLLEVAPSFVRFRHELARHAILASLPVARRRQLHGEILAALLARAADPAEIVHHADAAGAEDVLASHVLVAARRAVSVEANREAFSHFRRAAAAIAALPPGARAQTLEERAQAGYMVDRLDDAIEAIGEATALYRAAGDAEGVGRCTRKLARLQWAAGQGGPARASAEAALAILEPLGASAELARAYAAVAQLAMLAEQEEDAIAFGERAVELATLLGDAPTRAHALVTLGTARVMLDPADRAPLLTAHEEAVAAGDPYEATRALLNLAFTLIAWIEPVEARAYAERGLAHSTAHEVHGLRTYAEWMLAWLDLRAGHWAEAEPRLAAEREHASVSDLLRRTLLAELAVRRGDPGARELLAIVADEARLAGEDQRTTPVLELEVEWALLHGEPFPVAALESRLAEIDPAVRRPWSAAHVCACAALAGLTVPHTGPASAPHAAMARGDWHAAADAFGDVGWTYDRALMLSLTDDEPSLAEALSIARGLGAEPLVRRVAGRMRARSLRVPAGPRDATLAHPAGLTARQSEVLALLTEGLANAEIAARLVLSPRTVEHHVAAIIAKLGATSRREAARRASELGLLSG